MTATNSPMPSNSHRFSACGRNVARTIIISALVTACAALPSNAIQSHSARANSEASSANAPPPNSEVQSRSSELASNQSSSTIKATHLAQIADPKISEASGMAVSGSDQAIWLINDGGNGPFLYAIDQQGQTLAKLTIAGVSNRDWEDLGQFQHQGQSYLIIADTGDNLQRHAQYRLIVVKTPALTGGSEPLTGRLSPSKVLNFRYEDGSHDTESIAYDPSSDQVLLLTKRDKPAGLYALPLAIDSPSPSAPVTARLLAHLPQLPKPTLIDIINNPILGHFAAQPTAMDLSANGLSLAVLTYNRIYLFQRQHNTDSWQNAFKNGPTKLLNHTLPQAEALSFSANGEGILYTSERSPAPLWFATLPR